MDGHRKTVLRLISLLKALFTAAAVSIYLDISAREPLTVGLIAALYLLFIRAGRCEKGRAKTGGLICGVLFALFTVLGGYAELAQRALYPLSFPICFLGFFLLYAAALTLLFSLCMNISLVDAGVRDLSAKRLWGVFLSAFAALFLWSALWLFLEYPGNTTADSIDQLMQAMGTVPLKNNHPAAHTLFVKLFFVTGLKLFHGNQNAALAFYIVFQCIFMAAIFAYTVETMYKKRIKRSALYAVMLLLIAVPFYASYSITLWKDVLFSGLITAMCVTLWRLSGDDGCAAWELAVLYVFGLGAALFRNMSYAAFFVLFPFVFALLRKKSLAAAVMPLAVGIAAALICGPVYSHFRLADNDALESLGVPMQHVAGAISDGAELTGKEYAFLEKVVSPERIPENYLPGNVDYIKELIRTEGNVPYLDEHTGEFMRLWLELGRRYPLSYLKAQIEQTKGYWFPDVSYWSMANFCAPIDTMSIYKDPPVPSAADVFNRLLQYINYAPVLSLFFSIGLAAWIVIALFALCIIRGAKKELVLFVPVLLLLITLCAVTPVYAEFRYAYSMFTTLPLLTAATFGSQRK